MPNRLPKALLTLLAWLAATVGLGAFLRQEQTGIAEIVGLLSTGIALNVIAGIAVLALATWAWLAGVMHRPDTRKTAASRAGGSHLLAR
mgnify:CR=1 FL=1